MKHIFKLLSIVFVLAVMSACNDGLDTTYSTLDTPEKGSVITYSDVQNGFFDFVDLDNASVGFTLDALGADPSSIIIYKSVNGQARIKHAEISTIPSTVTVTFPEVLDGTNLTNSDISLGDKVTFTFEAVTGSGNFISERVLNVDVSCPSDLAGTYSSITTGQSTDGCCPDPVTVEGEVTLTDTGGGTYSISAFSAGIYFAWYEVYGITGDVEGSFTEVCGDINGTFGEPFGSDVVLTGSVDPDTGVITYEWENGYDDTATVTLTPQ